MRQCDVSNYDINLVKCGYDCVKPCLNGGEIAGIVIGSVVGVILIIALIWYFMKRRNLQKNIN